MRFHFDVYHDGFMMRSWVSARLNTDLIGQFGQFTLFSKLAVRSHDCSIPSFFANLDSNIDDNCQFNLTFYQAVVDVCLITLFSMSWTTPSAPFIRRICNSRPGLLYRSSIRQIHMDKAATYPLAESAH